MTVDKSKLLKAIYEAIQWDRLYAILPQADRRQVDEFFQELRDSFGPQPQEDLAAEVAGGHAVLCCDGASSGNPGPAGIGVVLATEDGREVLAWGRPIGKATNNVAEYRAVTEGLTKALELGVEEIEVRTDSELLVKQVTGDYGVKSAGLQPLHAQVTGLLARFRDWRVRHVPRAQNRRADSLAVEAARSARTERGGQDSAAP